MPDYSEIYRKQIQEGRNRLFNAEGLPVGVEKKLREIYAQMVTDITTDVQAGAITAERAAELTKKIEARFSELAPKVDLLFQSAKIQSAQIATHAQAQGTLGAAKAAGVELSVSFNDIPERALNVMMAKRGLQSKNYKTLINRGLQSAAEDVDRFIQSAIGRGTSSKRASRQLAAMLTHNDPEVLKQVQTIHEKPNLLKKTLETSGISQREYKSMSTLLYDTRRIMVTETISAYREADILSATRSPVVHASRWQLSGNHPKPDVCNLYAGQDQFGLGAGVYPSRNVPSSPHPYCSCYITSIIAKPSQWGRNAGAPLQKPPMVKKESLGNLFNGQTDNYIQAQIESANKYQQLAYRVAAQK